MRLVIFSDCTKMSYVSEIKSGIARRVAVGVNSIAQERKIDFKVTIGQVLDWMLGDDAATLRNKDKAVKTVPKRRAEDSDDEVAPPAKTKKVSPLPTKGKKSDPVPVKPKKQSKVADAEQEPKKQPKVVEKKPSKVSPDHVSDEDSVDEPQKPRDLGRPAKNDKRPGRPPKSSTKSEDMGVPQRTDYGEDDEPDKPTIQTVKYGKDGTLRMDVKTNVILNVSDPNKFIVIGKYVKGENKLVALTPEEIEKYDQFSYKFEARIIEVEGESSDQTSSSPKEEKSVKNEPSAKSAVHEENKVPVKEESESDDEEPAPAPKSKEKNDDKSAPGPKGKEKKPVAKEESDSDESDDEPAPAPKGKEKEKKLAAKEESDSDESDDEPAPAPKVVPKGKEKEKKPVAKEESDSEESDDD